MGTEEELSFLRPQVSELRHGLALAQHRIVKLEAENSALRAEIRALRAGSDTRAFHKDQGHG